MNAPMLSGRSCQLVGAGAAGTGTAVGAVGGGGVVVGIGALGVDVAIDLTMPLSFTSTVHLARDGR